MYSYQSTQSSYHLHNCPSCKCQSPDRPNIYFTTKQSDDYMTLTFNPANRFTQTAFSSR